MQFDGRKIECSICGEKLNAYVSEKERHMREHRDSEIEDAALKEVDSE